MGNSRFVFEKIYWLVVAMVPLLPMYAYGEYPSVRTCTVDGICFRTGGAFLNGDAEAIIYFSVIVLWPLCAWMLVGQHIFTLRHRPVFKCGKVTSGVFFYFGKLYWLSVAVIPFLLWYMFGTFLAPHDCAESRSCFQFYVPLTQESKIAVLIACFVLWPMCVWMVIGNRAIPVKRP